MAYVEYSKSERAIEAERDGLMTATGLAKVLKCPVENIRRHLEPAEAHHTSSWYNLTHYYYEPLLVALATGQSTDDWDEDEVEEARRQLEVLRQKREKNQVHYPHCVVKYLWWEGSRRFRKATEITEPDCDVIDKGNSIIVMTKTGRVFRKKKDTRGLRVYLQDGTRLI